MKSLLFIGHSFHKLTKSTEFFQEILSTEFNVEKFYFDPYKDDFSVFEELKGKEYDALVLFQIMPSLNELSKFIKFKHCAFVPMYDNTKTLNSPLWNEYTECNIINFSKTFHDTCKNAGLSSFYIQYFPEPVKVIDKGDKKSIFFWQRSEKITTKTLEKVVDAKTIDKLYFHKSPDPKNKFIKPSRIWDKKIEYSSWFDTKEEMQSYIQKSALYFAPRKYEGIGMSFLEAMAAGRCVIAPDYPAMNEYIINGVTGYLYNLKKPKKAEIKNIEQIQENAREYILKGYEKWSKEKQNICKFVTAKPDTNKVLIDKYIFIKRDKFLLLGLIPVKIEETAARLTYKLFNLISFSQHKV